MSKGKIIVQILSVIVVLFAIGPNAPGALINMTSAEQQVGGEIRYSDSGGDNLFEGQLDPDPDPQGKGDADLAISLDNIGVIISGSLTTDFSEDQVTGNGTAFASAVWGSQPSGAYDVHGGGGSTFKLYFTKETAPAHFQVNGQIGIDLENYLDLHPEEVFAYVKLSSDDGGGMTTIWKEAENGVSGDILISFTHGLWLETGKTYLLEAYAEAGTVASTDNPSLKSRTASFSFTTTVIEGEPANIDIVPDTISNKTKTITCHIWPPDGYDVTEIDADSIRLEESIPPLRTSVRRKQQMLVVKFSTSELDLTPTPELVLTVSGDLTDGTDFVDTDSVEVVQKGKPN
jgi:hypothetical protein